MQTTLRTLSASSPSRRSTDQGLMVVHEDGEINGAQSFTKSAERVVKYLNAHTPLTDWSVARVTQGEQIHVHVHQDELVQPGSRVDWSESFCERMAKGAAHVVRDSSADPDYCDLPAAQAIGAYAGYTISDDRGELFGVLCGARRSVLTEEETIDEDLVALLSELLSTQLELSRGIDRKRRDIYVAEALTHSDALTGLLNRRGWDEIVADAQERLDAFGDQVAVAFIDLDDLKRVNDSHGHAAGDELLKKTAQALQSVSTAACHLARYGGDEFVILANGVGPAQVENHFDAFTEALEQAGVRASLGFCAAEPARVPVMEAIERADKMMYNRKNVARRAKSSQATLP